MVLVIKEIKKHFVLSLL